MTYTQQGERVVLDMTREEYLKLCMVLGAGLSHLDSPEFAQFWKWLRLVNELNFNNPEFTPYEIPEGIE